MDKKKHRFYWEEPQESELADKKAIRAVSQPVIAKSLPAVQRRPFGFSLSLSFPKMPASRSDISVKESADIIIATAMLPGFEKNDIKIEIEPDHIKIRAEKKKSVSKKSESSSFSIASMSVIEKSASLPAEVEADKAIKDFSSGILTITMPKAKKKFKLFR